MHVVILVFSFKYVFKLLSSVRVILTGEVFSQILVLALIKIKKKKMYLCVVNG